jgi:hypothetical protein
MTGDCGTDCSGCPATSYCNQDPINLNSVPKVGDSGYKSGISVGRLQRGGSIEVYAFVVNDRGAVVSVDGPYKP